MKNQETILREDKREILSMVKDKQVINSLCSFIWCSQNMLQSTLRLRLSDFDFAPVTLRGEDKPKKIEQWYYSFTIPKWYNTTEFRTISAPFVWLKNIQSNLLQSLRGVPISIAAQWWELWTSPKKNAMHHRPSKYLYTTDVKSAYPSVSWQRIFKNLEGSLSKQIDMSFPYLSQWQRTSFFDVLTTLISHNNSLPQGAPTSARMLNIAMAKTDKDIIKYLNSEESVVIKPTYTRYIDDMALGFKHFKTFDDLAKQAHTKIKSLDKIILDLDNTSIDPEDTRKNLVTVQSGMLVWLNALLNISNDKQFDVSSIRRLREATLLIKQRFVTIRDHDFMNNQNQFEKNYIFNLIWDIDRYISGINKTGDDKPFLAFQQDIRKIVNENWRTLKLPKEKSRTPTSSTVKEVTWVLIWKDWRIWISQHKMRAYTAFAKTATLYPSQLDRKYKRPDWTIDHIQLAYVLHGIRNFIMDVKWHVPAYFEKRFKWAMAKHFAHMKIPKNVQSMRWVSGEVIT